MTKTPEQLAEEYVAHNRSYPYDPLNAQDRYMRNSYLVGYQAAKPQWISVKERLPEYDQLVLLWQSELQAQFVGRRRESGVMSPLYYWECASDFFEAWKEIYHPKLMNEDVVTYWQPLPKPPEDK